MTPGPSASGLMSFFCALSSFVRDATCRLFSYSPALMAEDPTDQKFDQKYPHRWDTAIKQILGLSPRVRMRCAHFSVVRDPVSIAFPDDVVNTSMVFSRDMWEIRILL